jgi:hypothetical protein
MPQVPPWAGLAEIGKYLGIWLWDILESEGTQGIIDQESLEHQVK